MRSSDFSPIRLYAICFALFCLSLFLTTYSARNPGVADIGIRFLGDTLHPIQRVVRGMGTGVESTWDGYVNLRGVKVENQTLREKLEALEAENSRLREVEKEVLRLRDLLGGATEMGFEGIAAEVIGYDPSNWVQAITVNRGSADGIVRGMAAVQGNLLVGKVIAVARRTAQVLLLLDPSSGVDALLQSSRVRGVVEGTGREGCLLRYVSQQESVQVGERVISSGMDGVFPKGLVIGVVAEVERKGVGLFQQIKINPSVRFRRLETILLVQNISKPEAPAAEPTPQSKDVK